MSFDWIDAFMGSTEGIPSPRIFRLWSGIAAVSGVLERRIWLEVKGGDIYPNLYVLLVGPPGSGKTVALSRIQRLWREIKGLHIAPNSCSKASLLDELEAAYTGKLVEGKLLEYHSLQVAASELGVLVPSYDLEFLSVLNDIYDCPPGFRDVKRTTKSVDIGYPSLNIIAGVQPGYLATMLPEGAWTMGFMGRMVMAYTQSPIPMEDIFGERTLGGGYNTGLLQGLSEMSEVVERAGVEDDARLAIQEWANAGLPPVPQHSRLQYYNNRRLLTTLKLCITSAMSRSREPNITLEDFNRAREWLFEAEVLMPDVFRDMAHRSDAEVLRDLHNFTWQMYNRSDPASPVPESDLYAWLSLRVPSEKIPRIMETADRIGLLNRIAGTKHYVPKPVHTHGVE